MMLRITAKIGLLADISGVSRTRSRRKLLFSRSYSPEKIASGISRRRASMSSSLTRSCGPCPGPGTGIEVREGQAMTMFSPRPCWFFRMRFCSASPKDTSSATDTVPQVMPNRVSSVRIFWCRTSCSICRRKDRKD